MQKRCIIGINETLQKITNTYLPRRNGGRFGTEKKVSDIVQFTSQFEGGRKVLWQESVVKGAQENWGRYGG